MRKMTEYAFHKSMIKNNLNATWVRRGALLAGIARASQILMQEPACAVVGIGDLQGLLHPKTKPLQGY